MLWAHSTTEDYIRAKKQTSVYLLVIHSTNCKMFHINTKHSTGVSLGVTKCSSISNWTKLIPSGIFVWVSWKDTFSWPIRQMKITDALREWFSAFTGKIHLNLTDIKSMRLFRIKLLQPLDVVMWPVLLGTEQSGRTQGPTSHGLGKSVAVRFPPS